MNHMIDSDSGRHQMSPYSKEQESTPIDNSEIEARMDEIFNGIVAEIGYNGNWGDRRALSKLIEDAEELENQNK